MECGPGARLQLDDELLAVRPGMCVLIRPGVRHRAIGKMRVLILVLPKFDPKDEWFDDNRPAEPEMLTRSSAVSPERPCSARARARG